MISLESCKKIIKSNGKSYTDEDVKQIRALLYELARIQLALDVEDVVELKTLRLWRE